VLIASGPLTILAQAADQTSVFIQYGAVGAIALLALGAVRVLFQRETKSLDLERERADRLEEELRRLNESIHDKYVPALERATAAIAQALETIRKEQR
jgi:hypothetical protein